jgi:predicted P-loop ATPase/GTPase
LNFPEVFVPADQGKSGVKTDSQNLAHFSAQSTISTLSKLRRSCPFIGNHFSIAGIA